MGSFSNSMGTFVFEMASDATYKSALFQCTFAGKKLTSLSIIPISISKKNVAPAPADAVTSAKLLKNIQSYSLTFNTKLSVSNGSGKLVLSTNQNN